ncbi:MAG: peptidoglycan DD-metalloendopeptidase family protein [Gallionella sp.]|nr:peptidoglycan DD-metalloendopeptidase family protein [Gallionella sp.]
MNLNHRIAVLAVALLVSACASDGRRAPVVEQGSTTSKAGKIQSAAGKKFAREQDWRPQTHTVQKGDTLYSIAFNYGLDYHELAQFNGIDDPNRIQVGQQLKLFPSAAARVPVSEIKVAEPVIKDQPKVVKYAYTDAAAAQIDKVQSGAPSKPVENAPAKPPVAENKPPVKAESKPAVADSGSDDADENIDWGMPTQGKIIADYSEAANRKGIDIGGKQGQAIVASAPGKVVYSGSGLRGYGKLIIIKHNSTYLSAYAHNDKVLVKEGQSVTRGQKIAEMGNSDADRVKLHFEVRRYGKPVDPAKYLPAAKS